MCILTLSRHRGGMTEGNVNRFGGFSMAAKKSKKSPAKKPAAKKPAPKKAVKKKAAPKRPAKRGGGGGSKGAKRKK